MLKEFFYSKRPMCKSKSKPSKSGTGGLWVGKSGKWKIRCPSGKKCSRARRNCETKIGEEAAGNLDNHTEEEGYIDEGEEEEEEALTSSDYILRYISRALIFVFIFILFIINLIALSISLQCNHDQGIVMKIASGLFAFMFGILYITVNYYWFRIREQNDPCVLCNKNIFGL